jgi:hypothetical protein
MILCSNLLHNCLRIPRDADQLSELMSITIPKVMSIGVPN